MAEYYLAVDLGASGGRHILGHVEGQAARQKLVLEEVHRFSHVPQKRDTNLVWDDEEMFRQIVEGLEKCGNMGKAPCSVGIDTWGVDYALVDRLGQPIKPVYAYRDTRTEAFMDTLVPFEKLYEVTGIAIQPFNTIYQVLADKAAGRLDKAEFMFQLPEYFSARLAGSLTRKENNEYTMASTTGLLDAKDKVWAKDVFEKLGLPLRLFKPIREPPYQIGELSADVQKAVGFNAKVVMIASHDTASAVAVTSADTLYISSGTWSLLGVVGEPVLSAAAREAGYTNEGAYNGKIRFLKNIMGLWVIQSVKRELGDAYTFAQLESMARDAERSAPPDWTVDVNKTRFFSPSSMINELKDEYKSTGQKVPQTSGELALCVYTSLATCYKTAIEDLEHITGKRYPSISIIGGGSKDNYLNSLTAKYTGKPVYTGPTEATAIGNILLQMKQAKNPAVSNGFADLVTNSFEVKRIE